MKSECMRGFGSDMDPSFQNHSNARKKHTVCLQMEKQKDSRILQLCIIEADMVAGRPVSETDSMHCNCISLLTFHKSLPRATTTIQRVARAVGVARGTITGMCV